MHQLEKEEVMTAPEFLVRLRSCLPTWDQLGVAAHRRAPWLIFVAVLAGVLCGSQFRRLSEPRLGPGDYDTFNNEARRGRDMPVLVMFREESDAESMKTNGHLDVADTRIE